MLNSIAAQIPQAFVCANREPTLIYHENKFWARIGDKLRHNTLISLSINEPFLILPICKAGHFMKYKHSSMLPDALKVWKPTRSECIELMIYNAHNANSMGRILEYYPDLIERVTLPVGLQYLNPKQEVSAPIPEQMVNLMDNPKEFAYLYSKFPSNYTNMGIPIWRILNSPVEVLQLLNVTPKFSLPTVLIAYRVTGKLPDITCIKNAAVDYLYRKLRPDYSVTRSYTYESNLAEVVTHFGLDIDILVPILHNIKDIVGLLNSLRDTRYEICSGYHTLYMVIMATIGEPYDHMNICDCIGCKMLLKKLQLN